MPMPMDSEIARSFLDWSLEEVSKWLSTLSLSQDYSEQFKAHQITGDILIRLNSAALDELRITEGADRVKILQQITTMRADLIIDSPARRVRSPAKLRRFSETLSRSAYSPGHKRAKAKYSTGVLDHQQRTFSPTKRGHTPISPKYLDGLLRISPESLSLESPISSGMSSPMLRSRDVSPYDGVVSVERRERELVNRLKANATLRGHNMKRLSRSLDSLFQEGEDIFSLSAKAEFQENCNSRLVDILREENTALKRDLETYYQRVRKLQKLEQEIEHIREGQRMLEAGTSRRERLEGALRAKLEKQVRSLRSEIVHLKADLHRSKKQEGPGAEIIKNGEANSTSRCKDIRRRDTMIMRLIKQNQDSMAAREKLEKDLHSTKIQLQERDRDDVTGDCSTADSHADRINSETERKMSKMYSQSIDKLKSVLSTMQSMSAKREKLEKHLRGQLLAEIRRLKGGSIETGSNGRKETHGELLVKAATLEADLIKWEQRCLELVAEKQMALEAAVIPRDSRMEQLERTVSEQAITIQELYQQRSSYISQLTDTNRSLAELETKVSSLRLTVNEKEAVIQALQNSFLDPEELSQDDYALMGSPVLHHSPVAAQKHSFSLIGAQVDVDGTVSLPGDIPSSYPFFPPSPPMKKRGPPNGAYARGHVTDNFSPMRRYSDKGAPVGPRSLSPVKRATAVATTPPVYTMKDPPAYASGSPTTSHYYPLPVSSSAPNSPNNRTGSRKSRISHPNMHFLQIPSSRSPPPSSPRKSSLENIKPNTSPIDTRRNHPKPPPLSPNPGCRTGKSKTPPPNYKLVSFSASSASNRGLLMSSKQRHHSVDDVLKDHASSTAPKRSKDPMEMFHSLLGDNGSPQTQSEYKQALQMGGVREGRMRQGHQHSKSSPSSERRNCYTVVN